MSSENKKTVFKDGFSQIIQANSNTKGFSGVNNANQGSNQTNTQSTENTQQKPKSK